MSSNTTYDTKAMLRVFVLREPKKDLQGFEELSALVKVFDREVWAKGLQDSVEADPNRGLECDLGEGASILTYVLAGRTMITLRQGTISVTALAADREKPSRMGLHGIEGTIDQGKALFQLACKVWKERGIQMAPNKAVTLDVLAAMEAL